MLLKWRQLSRLWTQSRRTTHITDPAALCCLASHSRLCGLGKEGCQAHAAMLTSTKLFRGSRWGSLAQAVSFPNLQANSRGEVCEPKEGAVISPCTVEVCLHVCVVLGSKLCIKS